MPIEVQIGNFQRWRISAQTLTVNIFGFPVCKGAFFFTSFQAPEWKNPSGLAPLENIKVALTLKRGLTVILCIKHLKGDYPSYMLHVFSSRCY